MKPLRSPSAALTPLVAEKEAPFGLSATGTLLLPGALGPGSGAVVFFGDANNLGGGGASDLNDDILILNSLALTGTPVSTPEPTSVMLLLTGLVALFALRLRSHYSNRRGLETRRRY